jgi:SOS-response transcriptional repressor LexA
MPTNEQNDDQKATRPTKKQKALLDYITQFIGEHGYSPSYREIKNGLQYNSVATVALHVNSLVKRGHLVKRENSARSLEPTNAPVEPVKTNQVTEKEEKWLVQKVEFYFNQVEQQQKPEQTQIDQLYVLVGSLKILGFDGAANSFIPRLGDLKHKGKGRK